MSRFLSSAKNLVKFRIMKRVRKKMQNYFLTDWGKIKHFHCFQHDFKHMYVSIIFIIIMRLYFYRKSNFMMLCSVDLNN